MSTISDHVWTQTPYRLRFEWGVEGVRRLAPVSELVVIIDVLSFTTCVEVAVSRDAVVFPYRYRDDLAIEFAQSVDAILAGNRGQSPSLSPASLLSLPYRSRLVLPSPNGSTCTVIAQDLGVRVLAGCLRNATAIASYIRCAYPSAVISLIACGEQWPNGTLRPAVEDLIGAGAILSQLDQTELSPESKIAVGAYEQVNGDLPTLVERCSSGRELMAKGFEEDVTMAGQLDVSRAVPILIDGSYCCAGPHVM